MASFNTYVSLTKPGIIRGNLLTAAAGFFLAAQGVIDFTLLAATLTGLACIVAAGCVFNNYIDRDIDKKMVRTKKRALVTAVLPTRSALLFGVALATTGVLLLGLLANFLTLAMAALGFVLYVFVYTPYKRRTVHGTLIGSLSGAIPPVVGYCAVSNQLDGTALILFLILIFWQMPHFYAIAIYRSKEYAAASIPVLPVVKGVDETKIQILFYSIGFSIAALSLALFGHAGWVYATVAGGLSMVWIFFAMQGFKTSNDIRWARHMFFYSLLVILLLCAAITGDSFI